MGSTNETPRAKDLGLRLRAFRERADLSQPALAAQIGCHPSEISRWENGRRGLDEARLGTILGALGVDSAEREEAFALYRRATDPNWLALGVSRQLAVVQEYEDGASRILNAQPNLIPGPLQTGEYAMSVMLAAGNTRAAALEGAEFRMSRAARIVDGQVEYTAIIGEYALRFPACDRQTGIEQLTHLVKVADLPHITVRAVPLEATYTPLRVGSFVLIESEDMAVVHLEQLGGSTTLTDRKYVNGYKAAADILRREAMSPVATTELIAQLIDDMERTT